MSQADPISTSSPSPDDAVDTAWRRAAVDLLDERTAAGHWTGELSTSALSTATAVSALVLARDSGLQSRRATDASVYDTMIDTAVEWLASHQNADGGWGDTPLSYSNISTTMLVLAAWKLAKRHGDLADAVKRGRDYIDRQGGIDGLRRRYGIDKTFAVPILANAAIAGEVPWREVAPLPFEAACVPQRWYRFLQLPVVSYAIPALVAIGQAKFHRDPPRNPLVRLLRRAAVARSLRVLQRIQPESGGYLEAIPLTSFVVMGLLASGHTRSPVVMAGLRFLESSVRADGSWPIDTNLATWNTHLALLALEPGIRREEAAIAGGARSREDAKSLADTHRLYRRELLQWMLACQQRGIHPFTGAGPGGWGWSDLSGAVPDADDTPAALLALADWHRRPEVDDACRSAIVEAVRGGGAWLLDLQNRDGGWPTFCRGWGKLPFDRSGCDLTAHAMRALWAWRDVLPGKAVERAIARGWRFLDAHQSPDGSWLPLWFGNQDHPAEENPIYGTVKVLAACRDLQRWDAPGTVRALCWLAEVQNDDGSWGGGPSRSIDGHTSTGSVEETALAVEIAASAAQNGFPVQRMHRGRDWLVQAVNQGRHRQASPIGFYFAKLWYYERLYPLIFTVAALGRSLDLDAGRSASMSDVRRAE